MLKSWWSRIRPRTPEPDFDAIEAELEQAVGEEIDRRLGPYLDSGDATLISHSYRNHSPFAFEITPQRPGAAAIYVSVSNDEVVLSVGSGTVDFFAEPGGDWRPRFGEVLEAIAEGRFREEVSKGWVFERNVDLTFPGTQLGTAGYARLTYATEDGEEVPPEIGEHTYLPWRDA